jgi:chromosome segregation ATPase
MQAEAQIKQHAQEIERLSKQLRELQDKCVGLEARREESESEVLNSKREAHAIARREAETRAELEGLRGQLTIAKDALQEAMNDSTANAELSRLQSRLQDAERRAMTAETSLRNIESGSPVSKASAEEVRILRQENSRLLSLLTRTNDELNEARRVIDERGYTEGDGELLVREQIRAAEERTRRVEEDFEQLVEQMRQMESGAGGELMERLQELEEENAELRESLVGTEEATLAMQSELARISEEYAALASTLTETVEYRSEESP